MPRIASDTDISINLTHSVGGTTALSAVLVERNRTEARRKTFLGAINIDGDVAGPARAIALSANLHAPSLLLRQSVQGRLLYSPIHLFQSHQSSWIEELRVLRYSRHTDFRDTISLKQALGLSSGDGSISASRMLNSRSTFVKAFMDMVGEGSGRNE
jgi:hypothetical protein